MKKISIKVVSVVLSICLLSSQTFAISGKRNDSPPPVLDESVFSFDEDLLNEELSELNALDAYLEANDDATFEELANEGNMLVANIDSSVSPMGMRNGGAEPPLGIPSFLWGCLFGLLGLLLVYIATDNDKAEAKKAMWGCVTSTVISTVLYIAAFAAVEAAD